jgi:hypothetical protein
MITKFDRAIVLHDILDQGLPFLKMIAVGLLATWLATALLETSPAYAQDAATPEAAPKGWGAGPITPTLASLVQRAEPVRGEEPPEHTFEMAGDIDGRMVASVEFALSNGFRKFVITSRGGEMLAARQMSEMFNDASAELAARGQCHSACAYMWLATSLRKLGPAAHLALHASYTAYGPNDYGARWLVQMGRPDLTSWSHSLDMHYLTDSEINGPAVAAAPPPVL